MPRAHLSKRLSDSDAIRLFAEHHIVQVRRRKNGEITAVKHATFGWLTPERFYALQKAHDLMPLVQEFIHGGYRLKQALWGTTVGGATVQVPVAAILVGGAIALSTADGGSQTLPGFLDLAALALPFGEIYLLLRGVSILGRVGEIAEPGLGAISDAIREAGGDPCERIRTQIAELESFRNSFVGSLIAPLIDEMIRRLRVRLIELGCP